MKIAIVHDYLNQFGGAERVVCELAKIYRDAPIYTSIYHSDMTWPELRHSEIRHSWLQNLPFSRKMFKILLPLYPFVFAGINLSGYDVVISSSSSFAKGIAVDKGTVHICYCHSPTRFLWFFEEYTHRIGYDSLIKRLLSPIVEILKNWDLIICHRPDYYIANSSTVQKRIRTIYHRESEIIHPPVDVDRFNVSYSNQGYYLIVSRLLAYKRVDLAVQTFNELGLPLVVIGDGPHRKSLEAMAQDNIRFTGYLPDREVSQYFEHCRAFILPGEEDFGITLLEANACGKPVIAYRAGGALDSIVEGLNGVFFYEKTAESLAAALQTSILTSWNPTLIRAHAEKFSPNAFRQKVLNCVREVLLDKYAMPQYTSKPAY